MNYKSLYNVEFETWFSHFRWTQTVKESVMRALIEGSVGHLLQ